MATYVFRNTKQIVERISNLIDKETLIKKSYKLKKDVDRSNAKIASLLDVVYLLENSAVTFQPNDGSKLDTANAVMFTDIQRNN